jgi:hypothetical protein
MTFHSLSDRLGGWCNGKRDHLAFGGSWFDPRLNQNQRLYLDKSVLQLMTMTPPRSRFGKSWFDIGQVNTKTMKMDISLFFLQCIEIGSKSSDGFTWNQDHMSEWTDLSLYYCNSTQAIFIYKSKCWSSTEQTSLAHQKITCSRHDITVTMLTWITAWYAKTR